MNAVYSQTGPRQALTAAPLVTHVPAVVVRVASPDAADAVPVAAAVLAVEAGALWRPGAGREEVKPVLLSLTDHKIFLSFHFSSSINVSEVTQRKRARHTATATHGQGRGSDRPLLSSPG